MEYLTITTLSHTIKLKTTKTQETEKIIVS